MEPWIKDSIQKIQASQDILEVKAALEAIKNKLGFKFFLYGVALPSGFTNIQHFIITDYPEQWMQEYKNRNYATVDPVVKFCSENREPYCWDRLLDCDNQEVVAFTKAAAGIGLVGGVSVGMQSHTGGFNIFSFATDHVVASGSDEAFDVVLYMNTFFPYLHEAVKKLSSSQYTSTNKPELTPREIDCLIWSAEGKTSEEIAQILAISAATAVFHLKNVIAKLEVTNRNQAIAKAVLYGIIAPQYSTLSSPKTYLF